MKKSILAILTAAVITISFLGPLLYTAVATDPTDWYKTVNGVLATDTYTLYPFSTSNSLKIGFSQFGEMINSVDNVGLEYGAVDPFAPPAGSAIGSIVKSAWLNGWLINITYYHTIRSQLRTVWADAQHGDPIGVTYGGNWIRVDFLNDFNVTYGDEDPRDPGFIIGNYAAGSGNYGGRKTNGTAVTQPIKVLYDGPRSYVALLTTTIYDHFTYLSDDTAEDIPLLEIRFMILFNKVKKEVVVFKELKTLVADKYADELKVQFSNRGEVDLGTEGTGYSSYFHFYTQGVSRDGNWNGTGKNYENNDTLAEGLSTVYDRNWVLNQTENPLTSTYYNYSASGPYPQVTGATYDLAVAINPTQNYTWWAAFWPSLSDWNIDGWPMWWRSMTANDPHDIDSRTWETIPRTEPTIPYYIAEWDVVLKPIGHMVQQQYRFVTIYGVTELNDGNDANQGGSNVIDRETMYQLDEYFNPLDLNSAVHKETKSWVEWTIGSTTYTTLRKPVIQVTDSLWDQYCQFSERVIDLNTSTLLKRIKYRGGQQLTADYSLAYNADGTATFTLPYSTHYYKILYDTKPDVTGSNSSTSTLDSGTAYNVTQWNFTQRVLSNSWNDTIGVTHGLSLTVPAITIYPYVNGTTNMGNWTTTAWTLEKMWNETDFKVFLGETYVSNLPDIYDPISVNATHETNQTVRAQFVFDLGALQKNLSATSDSAVIYPLPKETVHVIYLNHTINVTLTITQMNYTDGGGAMVNSTWTATLTTTVTADYRNKLNGRYEWTIVGKDASTVDSAGAALVTAAFKNKQVEIGLAGADMYNSASSLQMPWVMAKIGAGYTRDNYYYSGTDYRTALKDDWCHTWPIASSNMISVAGPRANVLTWYGNDFADAFFGLTEFTDEAAWDTKIVPKPCWNHTKAYASTATTGYAVVSTYKDLNGTVLFMIWGYDGIDTYYVTKWFHEEGIYQLQEAPNGLTSIIVKITYQNTTEGYKPTGYSIVECLGTISEREWIHCAETKGGIHDP